MSNQRTGKAFIYIDGTLYESLDGATLNDPAGVTRNPVIGDAGVYGYSETVVMPTLNATFAHGSGISSAAIAALTDDTIQFKCDSGVSFIMRNAFYQDGMKVQVNNGKGTIAANFGCKKCDELFGS